MTGDEKSSSLRIDIPNVATFEFSAPDELIQWNRAEYENWKWIQTGSPFTREIWSAHENFFTGLNSHANEWKQYLQSEQGQYVDSAKRGITNSFNAFLGAGKILWRDSPSAAFIGELRGKFGDVVASGAYSFL